MNDLVERLKGLRRFGSEHFAMLYEAADTIERLQAELTSLTTHYQALLIDVSSHKHPIITDLKDKLAAAKGEYEFCFIQYNRVLAELAALKQGSEPVAWLPSSEWTACIKLPVTVHVRKQREGETHVSTREGITPVRPDDLIMRGVSGEEYPIGRKIFEQTYRMGEPPTPTDRDAEDARRYRWLRDRPNYVVTPTFKRGNINGVSIKPYGCSEYYQHETLEAAIDFAMQEGK